MRILGLTKIYIHINLSSQSPKNVNVKHRITTIMTITGNIRLILALKPTAIPIVAGAPKNIVPNMLNPHSPYLFQIRNNRPIFGLGSLFFRRYVLIQFSIFCPKNKEIKAPTTPPIIVQIKVCHSVRPTPAANVNAT